MKKVIVSGILAGSITTSAFAAGGNTGCGLGQVIMGEPKGIITQVLKFTSNHATSSQFLGITFGTSGCSKATSIVDNDTHKFVDDNMDRLALDISKGQGESLDTLALLLRVENKKEFAVKLQTNFDKIYTSENITSSEVIDNIFKITA